MNDSTPLPGSGAPARGPSTDAAEGLRQLWLLGQRPEPGEFLAHFGALPPAEVAAVLRVDQAQRWRLGERIPSETYLRNHAGVAACAESALDLIYGEYLLHERSGDPARLEEFLARFPEHAAVLRMQIELHQAIAVGTTEADLLSRASRFDKDMGFTFGEQGDAVPDGGETSPTQMAFPDRAGAGPAASGTRGRLAAGRASRTGMPVVAGYDLLAEVGRGGMGVIYQARQLGLNRLVALKMISSGHLASPGELARFRTEAEAVARLHHPNVVQIYEVGQQQGLSYLALEFMDKGSLAPHLTAKVLSPRHAAELIETLARAVQAAHDQGIIHRDLKPANVLLATPPSASNPTGVVGLLGIAKITDFGLAKRLDGEPGALFGEPGALFGEPGALATGGHTISGTILGTPGYMAPEQAEGKTRHVGPAADIYSLGAILYEALTGRPPFAGGTLLETLERVRSQEPVSPSRLQPNLPRDLVTICLKALAKEPGRRYPSAAALADDLRRFQEDKPVKARAVTPWERGWRWCRRNPVIAGLSGGLTLLVVVMLVGLAVATLIRQERDTALANRDRAEKAEAQTRSLQKEIIIREHLARAASLRASRQPGQRFKALAELKAALRLEASAELRHEIRNEVIAALVLADVQVAREWDGWPEGTVDLAFDAAMQRYARLDQQGGVTVYRLTAAGVKEVARLPPQGRPVGKGIWMSPDGRHVLFVHQVQRGDATPILVVWRIDGTAPRRIRRERVTQIPYGVAFQPRGTLVATSSVDQFVTLYDLNRRRKQRLPFAVVPYNLAFSPDGTELAVAAGKDVCIHQMATGEKQWLRHPGPIKEVTGLAWHPDGRRLATGADDFKIHIWDVVAGRQVTPPWPGHDNFGIDLKFNRAGDRLISIDWDAQTRLWDAVSGRILLTMPSDYGVQFSEDDSLLGYQRLGNKVRLWRLAAGYEMHVIPAPTGDGQRGSASIYGPLPHPDGHVLCASTAQGLGFYDLLTGAELASVPLPKANYSDVRCYLAPGGWVVTSPAFGSTVWPARPDPAGRDVLQVGPPQNLDSRGWTGVSASPDGQVVVLANGDGALLWHRGGTNRRMVLGPQKDVRSTAVSPDKHWVVTVSFNADPRSNVRVWDAATGRHIKDLELESKSRAWFSPDSRWLFTQSPGQGCRLWQTGTWRTIRRYDDARAVFSPDRRTLALNDVLGQILLLETATGREIARLTGPEPLWYDPACFSPDGTRLIAVSRDKHALYVWDLRLIRQRLKEMELDWEGPAFGPPPAPRGPSRVQVDRGFLQFADPLEAAAVYSLVLVFQPLNAEAYLQRGLAYGRLQKAHLAIADYTRFLVLSPRHDSRRVEVLLRRSNNYLLLKDIAAQKADLLSLARLDLRTSPFAGDVAFTLHDLARTLLQKPSRGRKGQQALTLARKIVELEPRNGAFNHTLGVAHFRLGQYRQAAAVFERNLEYNARSAGFDLYFLAMSHHQLGHQAKDRDYFRRALRWQEQNESQLGEGERTQLRALRDEARRLSR